MSNKNSGVRGSLIYGTIFGLLRATAAWNSNDREVE